MYDKHNYKGSYPADQTQAFFRQMTHNLHLPKPDRRRLNNAELGGSWVSLDNKVTLLHEIGYSKQWIEHRGWFDNDYRTQTKRGAGDGAPKLKDISAQENDY